MLGHPVKFIESSIIFRANPVNFMQPRATHLCGLVDGEVDDGLEDVLLDEGDARPPHRRHHPRQRVQVRRRLARQPRARARLAQRASNHLAYLREVECEVCNYSATKIVALFQTNSSDSCVAVQRYIHQHQSIKVVQ